MARDVFGDVLPEGRKAEPVLMSPSTSGLLFQHWVIPCIVTELQFLGEWRRRKFFSEREPQTLQGFLWMQEHSAGRTSSTKYLTKVVSGSDPTGPL